MKISLIPVLILTFGWCSYATESSGQSLLDKKLALKIRNEEIKKVIYQIEKITDAKFMYSPQLIQSFRKVDLTVNNQKLSDVLMELFTPLDIKYELVENYIILNKKEDATKKGITTGQGNPPRTITGKITDENGQPLEGVSIKLQNGTAIAVTKADGRYTINTGDATDITLLFSSVGYINQEIKITGKTVINVMLKKLVTNLDDVVVIAYGKASRRSITNSIVSLSGKDVEDIPVASAAEAMVGLVAGANISIPSGEPGSAPVIRIRGVGSIGAGNNPLFVVDGYPLNSADNFNQISPADIQSIQVLKDAAACAIYGSRGGNGIILVTTKRGSAGKPRFNFTTHTGFQQVSKKVDVLNSPQFVSYLKDAYANGGSTLPTPYTDPNATYANTDWQNAIFKTALQSNIQLSASGGSDNARYYIAGSYFKQDGIIKGTGTDRYSMRMNYDAKLSRKLSIGISMAPSFSRVDTRPISGTFNGSTITGGGSSIVGASVTDALLLPPVLPQFIANGDYGQYSNTGNLVTINIYNPVATLDLYQDHTNSFRGLGTTFLEWEIIKGLTFKTNVGGEILFSRRNWYVPATLATASSTTRESIQPCIGRYCCTTDQQQQL
ncbi:hypothetical protein F5148DRAFT_1286206 [Russula earlei]|uniref:Uncharacterized protein n=1 Tax=Russula earlei TaxID=71964 RepID=A0ACC0U6E9_9AGAM|nr:hypothetical protein F5148DRAFT_1286206 [Russula earlei]